MIPRHTLCCSACLPNDPGIQGTCAVFFKPQQTYVHGVPFINPEVQLTVGQRVKCDMGTFSSRSALGLPLSLSSILLSSLQVLRHNPASSCSQSARACALDVQGLPELACTCGSALWQHRHVEMSLQEGSSIPRGQGDGRISAFITPGSLGVCVCVAI